MPRNFAEPLSENVRGEMASLLNETMASGIDLTLAVKQAHWNLKGSGFIGVHELLDDVADRMRDRVDLMAERAVIMGGVAKGTLQDVAGSSKLDPYPDSIIDITEHLQHLSDRFVSYGRQVREAIESADEAGDEDTADLFTEVSRGIDKDAWFIGANLPDK